MRSRRASLGAMGTTGAGSTSSRIETAPAEDNGFPIDSLAPDDLPVRDVSDDQEEAQPTPGAKAKPAWRAVTSARATPAPAREADGTDTTSIPSTSSAPPVSATLQEPAAEQAASEPVPMDSSVQLPTQYLLPGLGLEDSSTAQPNSIANQARPRRPRRSAETSALRAEQTELWPSNKG
jgi:hypothetical protein